MVMPVVAEGNGAGAVQHQNQCDIRAINPRYRTNIVTGDA
jgi:hypothetical protein